MAATDSPATRGSHPSSPPAASSGAGLADGQPVLAVDGKTYRDLLNAGMAWLDHHHELVNALNVFPVPDGDTGTNMLLTMRSACQEITGEVTHSVGEVASTAAHGALMGARGNSGVILSQILRGMAGALDGQRELTAVGFAEAMREGSRIAYRGVNRPVEGTILTVAKEAAAAAQTAADVDRDLRFVMTRTLRAADEAVINTPNLLPVLAQAGKVDSGGKGLFFILEGMLRALLGETEIAALTSSREVEIVVAAPRPAKGRRDIPELVYGFDVQFLVEGADLDVDAIRTHITAMGDCPLVEGTKKLIKVHVHVPDPGVALSYAVSLGFVTDLVVENMDDMLIPDMPPGYDPLPPRFGDIEEKPSDPAPFEPIEGPGIIAVAPGPGLADVFRSLGAHIVISGGQTMNPSTHDLYKAIEILPASDIIILPNNGNITMAAQQAQSLATESGEASAHKNVAVVPSKTVPQGISALLAVAMHADLKRNVEMMTAALAQVQTGEVTIAVQDAKFDGVSAVRAGDVIGLLNDKLTTKGPSPEAVVRNLLMQMHAVDLEVITLYCGEPVSAQEAEALRADLIRAYPDQEIEIVDGGQPFYHYIISAE